MTSSSVVHRRDRDSSGDAVETTSLIRQLYLPSLQKNIHTVDTSYLIFKKVQSSSITENKLSKTKRIITNKEQFTSNKILNFIDISIN